MSEVFISEMEIPEPNYNLNVGSGSHGWQTARMIEGIEGVLEKEQTDYIVLYGDTNSTLAGAIAASKMQIPIVHIEAGLRSYNRSMPEEINRVACDHLSTLLFSPTKAGFHNLIQEGFKEHNQAPFTSDNPGLFHCGDVMYDNSLYFAEKAAEKSRNLEEYDLSKGRFILTTIHRNNNTDESERLKSIINALFIIAKTDTVVLPLHPRTRKMLQTDEKQRSVYSAANN